MPQPAFIYAFVLASGCLSCAAAAELDEFFQERPGSDSTTLMAAGKGARRVRSAVLNPCFRSAASEFCLPGRFRLNLFNDEVHIVHTDGQQQVGPNRRVCHGHIEGEPESRFLMAIMDQVVAGSLHRLGQNPIQIGYTGGGLHRITELDPATILPCPLSAAQAPALVSSSAPLPERQSLRADSATLLQPSELPSPISLIDIMVVYTAAAQEGAGGEAGITTLIDLAVVEANAACEGSGVNARLRLVHYGEIVYAESANLATDLDRLRGKDDGFLDDAHRLRDEYQADLVCLLVESSHGAAGLGYLMTSPDSGFEAYAFSVVQRQFVSGIHSLLHEVGHNLGCAHDRENAPISGAYPYSYGNRFTIGRTSYRTVMAYAPGEPTGLFSGPDVLFKGVPTGIPDGSPGAADNARTCNNTAPIVAGFRTPRPPNDDFADRISLSGSVLLVQASSRLATKEAGEPNHAGATGGRSVWWSWTAAASGPVTVSTAGSDFDTVLAVYTGDVISALTLVAANDDAAVFPAHDVTSLMTFDGVTGARYEIAVDGFSEASGDIVLHLSAPAPPPLVIRSFTLLDGSFHLRLAGKPGQVFRVEVSADLSDWMILETASLATDLFDFVDNQADQLQQRFYRIVTVR